MLLPKKEIYEDEAEDCSKRRDIKPGKVYD